MDVIYWSFSGVSVRGFKYNTLLYGACEGVRFPLLYATRSEIRALFDEWLTIKVGSRVAPDPPIHAFIFFLKKTHFRSVVPVILSPIHGHLLYQAVQSLDLTRSGYRTKRPRFEALKLGSLAAIARRLCAATRWLMHARVHSCILTGKTSFMAK